MLRSLVLSGEDELPDLRLIEETYLPGPARSLLWDTILADAGLGKGRLRSRPGRAIELYQDAVLRHAASGAIALTTVDGRGELQHLSFAELDARATACAAAWSLAGLEPEDVVALAVPVGVTWLVAFAAALRLGLTVSCLASLGGDAISRRLRALAPKRVVFDPAGAAPPAEFSELSLQVVLSGSAHAPPVRAYAPGQPLGAVFSPVRAPVDQPLLLPAETALLWALRDARFAYRLGPDTGLAMPGFPPEQHQPAVILATLLAGSRFVELPMTSVARSPAVLAQPFITTLGVSPALRDQLRRTPAGLLPQLRGWFRSVDEPLDWEAFRDFVEKNALQTVPVSNVLVDAASGGALLVSASRPGSANAFVVPSPGFSFVLADVGSGAPAVGGAGVFAKGLKPDPNDTGWFLVVKRGGEYLYGSTLTPRRAGRVFPEDEVVECVTRIPGVDGACVVPVATGDPGAAWAFVLLVLVGALAERRFAGLRAEIHGELRTRLGSDFLPDVVQVFPLHARFSDQKQDLDWCRRQYSAGFLPRKTEHPVFRGLTALRECLRTDADDVR
jgi:hypothetical protein